MDGQRRMRKGINGYQDGLLVHVCEWKTGEQLVRIEVPDCRRRKVLQVSHSALTGGHFSSRKTEAALRRTFTWPRVSKDGADLVLSVSGQLSQ